MNAQRRWCETDAQICVLEARLTHPEMHDGGTEAQNLVITLFALSKSITKMRKGVNPR